MKSHVEIEAKYDVAEGQALPDLVGVGGVVTIDAQAPRVLTAVYFDTPGHDLGAAGVTLRRRTGGTDDGWHLKVTLARGERLELHRPLGVRRSPPAALQALVRAFVRSNPLIAVATLTNRRTVHLLLDGDRRLLAELADDSVTGERHDVDTAPMVWREVEVELVEGDREVLAALDAAVRNGGAVPAVGASKVGRVLGDPPAAPVRGRRTPVSAVFDAEVRQAVLQLLSVDPLVRLDRSGAATQMAAALHRLDACLAVQQRVAPDQTRGPIRGGLVWLDAVVARLAELDPVRVRLLEALSAEPAELVLSPVRRRIVSNLVAARRTALADVRAALDSPRYLNLLQNVSDLRFTPSAARAVDVRPKVAARELRRAQRQLARLSPDTVASAEQAVAQAGCAEQPEAVLVVLDELTATFADLRVSARLQDVLREMALAANESAFTLGRLHGLEQLHRGELHQRLRDLRKMLKRTGGGSPVTRPQ